MPNSLNWGQEYLLLTYPHRPDGASQLLGLHLTNYHELHIFSQVTISQPDMAELSDIASFQLAVCHCSARQATPR